MDAFRSGTGSNKYLRWVAITELVQIYGFAVLFRPDLAPAIVVGFTPLITSSGMFFGMFAIYIDAMVQERDNAPYQPRPITWMAAAFVLPVVVPAWYLFRRVRRGIAAGNRPA